MRSRRKKPAPLDPIFIHIPNTGGKTTKVFFKRKLFDIGMHLEPSFIRSSSWYKRASFTFVRNPFDRLLSSYFLVVDNLANPKYSWISFWHEIANVGMDEPGKPTPGGFERFVGTYFSNFQKPSDLMSGYEYHRHLLLFPQSHWFDDKLKYTYVGRYERFERDLRRIAGFVSAKTIDDVPRLNASSRVKKWHKYYTPEMVKLVARFYEEDFRRFGYREIL